MTVAVERITFEIFVMGHKKFVGELKEQISDILRKVEDELDRKKTQIIETIELKHHQILLLSMRNFKEEMEGSYKGMKVNFDLNKRKLTLEGLSRDVQDIKLKIYEQKEQIRSCEVTKFTQHQYKLLQNKLIKQYVAKHMKYKNLLSVWELVEGSNQLMMFGFSDNDTVNSVKILQKSIVQAPFDIKQGAKQLRYSEKWDTCVSEIKKDQNIKFPFDVIWNEDNLKVEVLAVDEDSQLLMEHVRDFFNKNTIMETAISVSPPMYRFLDKNGTKRIGEICQNLKDEQVKITISNGKLSISGTEVGLSNGKLRLQQLMDQIEKKEHILKKPGIFKLMTSDEGKEKICRVEERNNVVMEHSTDSDASDEDGTRSGSHDSQRGKLVKEVARCSLKGYQFLVMLGDVTELQVDVLVNAANKDLNHVGGLAKAIVKKGRW